MILNRLFSDNGCMRGVVADDVGCMYRGTSVSYN